MGVIFQLRKDVADLQAALDAVRTKMVEYQLFVEEAKKKAAEEKGFWRGVMAKFRGGKNVNQ